MKPCGADDQKEKGHVQSLSIMLQHPSWWAYHLDAHLYITMQFQVPEASLVSLCLEALAAYNPLSPLGPSYSSASASPTLSLNH